MKRGTKVRTIYGQIETVMYSDFIQVITYESAREGNWYHPTKVFIVKETE